MQSVHDTYFFVNYFQLTNFEIKSCTEKVINSHRVPAPTSKRYGHEIFQPKIKSLELKKAGRKFFYRTFELIAMHEEGIFNYGKKIPQRALSSKLVTN